MPSQIVEVPWASIEAECGDYRSGFIAVFRKYEGQVTDERDAQNRRVKVTKTSFARHMGIPESTFKDWVRQDAGGRRAPNQHARLTEAINREPEKIVELFQQAPPEARKQIAQALGKDPSIRAAARQHDEHDDAKRKPSPAKQGADLTMFQFESKLATMYGAGKQALALLNEVDQPGDDEDIIDQLGRIKQLTEILEEAYRTGKSLDTWAAELYEGSAE